MKGLLGEETAPEPEGSVITSGVDTAGIWSHREIITAINSLKNGKAPGPDNIEVEMLKHMTGTRTLHCLSELFNSCRRLGYFPNIWKNANLKILLKSEDKDETQEKSYRPICLLPILSKVLEKLINKTRVSLAGPGACLLQTIWIQKRSTWGVPFECIKALYKGVFLPTVLYAARAWGHLLSNTQAESIQSVQRQPLLRICRGYSTTSTAALQVINGELPLDLHLKEKMHLYKIRKGIPFTFEEMVSPKQATGRNQKE
ncbi:unnamed protein product [Trichogramma brassicae]|uniref:Reverse transcriptase domain-containing protein n=1 Tax=Trichogramma brassicae TaxID=86971 RepID=A0A6H5IFY9_9HYME|nr:unnamed protein product [Trichogramma brassicae]